MKDTLVIGEIVEVSTLAFTAQCLKRPRPDTPCFFDPPDFGTLVKIAPSLASAPPAARNDDEEEDPFAPAPSKSAEYLAPNATFAVVSYARMGSLEPGRRASALGYADESELFAHQPQLAELITTEFSGILIAHTDDTGRLLRYLPPRPPRIHSRVAPCTAEEARAITADASFLRTLIGPSVAGLPSVPQDELASAALRAAWAAHDRSQAYLVDAGKRLLELLADDYERFQAIMGGVL